MEENKKKRKKERRKERRTERIKKTENKRGGTEIKQSRKEDGNEGKPNVNLVLRNMPNIRDRWLSKHVIFLTSPKYLNYCREAKYISLYTAGRRFWRQEMRPRGRGRRERV